MSDRRQRPTTILALYSSPDYLIENGQVSFISGLHLIKGHLGYDCHDAPSYASYVSYFASTLPGIHRGRYHLSLILFSPHIKFRANASLYLLCIKNKISPTMQEDLLRRVKYSLSCSKYLVIEAYSFDFLEISRLFRFYYHYLLCLSMKKLSNR